jgi:HKD family nuclease
MPSGVERLYPHFDDLLRRGGSLRLLTGDYLGVTDPDALQRLIDLRAIHGSTRLDLRVYVTAGRSFHPKAYLLTGNYANGVAWVGSSNLSASALVDGIEWNYRVESRRDAAGLALVRGAFEALFADPATRDLDEVWLAEYRSRREHPGRFDPHAFDYMLGRRKRRGRRSTSCAPNLHASLGALCSCQY